jgi:hypothetical protein
VNSAEDRITAEVEDRFRAASRALTERFPDSSMPALHLPIQPAGAPAQRQPRRQWSWVWAWRRHSGWLIPIAAAAAVVTAIAASLAIAGAINRGTGGPPANGPAGTPPYFVTTTSGTRPSAVVGSTANGQILATIRPSPPYIGFKAITGAADGWTFLLSEYVSSGSRNAVLLRIDPGSGHVELSPLGVSIPKSGLCSLALSPDGTELATAYSPVCTNPSIKQARLLISVYHLSTGTGRSWSSEQQIGNPANTPDRSVLVSWQNDRILGYNWTASAQHMLFYSRLDVTNPGIHLPTRGQLMSWQTRQATLTAHGVVAALTSGGSIVEDISSEAAMDPVLIPSRFFEDILWVNARGTVLITAQGSAKAHIGIVDNGHYQPLFSQDGAQPVVW